MRGPTDRVSWLPRQVKDRTSDLDRQRQAGTQTPANEVADELQRLSREQGELAALIERLGQ